MTQEPRSNTVAEMETGPTLQGRRRNGYQKGVREPVEMGGTLYEPGVYGCQPGLRLSELVGRPRGFRSAVYAGRAHIERLNSADCTRFMVVVELPEDSAQPYPNDLALEVLRHHHRLQAGRASGGSHASAA